MILSHKGWDEMIYDEQTFDLLNRAELINRMLLESEVYVQYRACFIEMQLNEEVRLLEREFKQLKERYDEVMRFGRYHPDYMEVLLSTRRAKKAYEMHPLVAETKQLETSVQTLLDEIITIVASSISAEIKVERGNPFFTTEHQCSSGCSCSA